MSNPSLKRLPDWEERLSALIAEVHGQAFAWGTHDCMMFFGRVVLALTGHDPRKGHRGKYRSQATASRYLREIGFDSPEGFVDAMLDRIPRASARRGDIVLHEGALGVCMGSVALFAGHEGSRNGLVRIPMKMIETAWSVG